MNSLKEIQNKTEFIKKLIEAENIFNEIYDVCPKSYSWGGSYLFSGKGNYQYDISMLPKQELLYSIAKNANSVLEIGTYMGHSLLIMLLANPKLKIVSIDIDSTYVKPALSVLSKYFPLAQIEFLNGNSIDVLHSTYDVKPSIYNKTFDIFHIDGYHADQHISKEVQYCIKLTSHAKDKIVKIIFDDVDCCPNVINYIKSKYTVSNFIKPECAHTNAYLEFIV